MSPEERRKLTKKMRKQRQLSPAKQKEIREKVKQMTPEERRQFLDEIKRQRKLPAPQ
jgi:tellurite resistance protein